MNLFNTPVDDTKIICLSYYLKSMSIPDYSPGWLQVSRLNKGQMLAPSRGDNSREMGSAAESPSFGNSLDVDAAVQACASHAFGDQRQNSHVRHLPSSY